MFKKHISHIFLVALFLFSTNLKSEVKTGILSWTSGSDSAIHLLDVNTGLHTAMYPNHIDTLRYFELKYPKNSLPAEHAGHVFWKDGSFLGVFDGFGIVLRIDTAAYTVERHDRTVHSGYNFESYQFLRNDTLYSFGGYGFWMENNLLTFYSEIRREWNKYSVAPYPVRLPDMNNTVELYFYDRNQDVFFVSCEDRLFEYDFKLHKWSNKGYLNIELERSDVTMQHGLSDSTLLVMGPNRAWSINFSANTARDVTMANRINVANYRKVKQLRCAYHLEGRQLIIPRVSELLDQGYVFEFASLPMKSMSGPVVLTSRMSKAQKSWLLGISAGIIILLGGFYFLTTVRKNSQKKLVPFSPRQIDVLKALSAKALTTEDLNSILEMESKSWEVQRRERSMLVKELNQLGMEIFGQELVLREKAPHDKRQVQYVLNEELRSDLARLMR